MNIKKILTAVAILTATLTYAQDNKEGSVTYVTTMERLAPEQAAIMGDMETIVSFKNGKSLTEINSMMYTGKILNDENGMLALAEAMGNKTYVKMTKEEMEKKAAERKEKEKTADPKIEYTDETKSIAGYDCKKAIVTMTTQKDGETKTDVWYTDKIPYISAGGRGKGGEMFPGLKGMPLEYSFSQGAMKMKMVAKSVSFDKLPDSKFVLSTEGYTESKGFPGQGGGNGTSAGK